MFDIIFLKKILWGIRGGMEMKKYYENGKYNAAFERCIDVMARLMQKYGPELLRDMEIQKYLAGEGIQQIQVPSVDSRIKRLDAYRSHMNRIVSGQGTASVAC